MIWASRRQAGRDRRFTWTQAQMRQLRLRWATGAPASQIARELGGGISKSAVLAKVRRLRLAGRRRTVAGRTYARKAIRAVSLESIPDRLRARKSEKWRYPTWVVEAKPYVDDPGADADIPLAQRRPLVDLSRGMCRWPVGDPERPGFFFCGGPCHDERPYCTDHCARAYRGFATSEWRMAKGVSWSGPNSE
jgi:GcrA cell cycle regulator